MYEIFFNWCGDMSKNTVKNGKQKNRVGGSKLGIICSRIRRLPQAASMRLNRRGTSRKPAFALREGKCRITR